MQAFKEDSVKYRKMRRVAVIGVALICVAALASASVQLSSKYYGVTRATPLRGLNLDGDTLLTVTGTKIDDAPTLRGGKYTVKATATHRSTSGMYIDLIAVEGELTLEWGSWDETDTETDVWLVSNKAEAKTTIDEPDNWVYGDELGSVGAHANSIHSFYDERWIPGWFDMESEAFGSI